MTWFSRSDILEIFRDAQDSVVRKSYARFATDPRVWRSALALPPPPERVEQVIAPLQRIGPVCLQCDERSVRIVYGRALCELHADHREKCLEGLRRRRNAA